MNKKHWQNITWSPAYAERAPITSLKNVKTKPGAYVDTDHMLLWGEIKWKLRRLNNSERQLVKWNIHDLKCENTQQRYEVAVTNRFEALMQEDLDIDLLLLLLLLLVCVSFTIIGQP